jgi:precorrin-6Y C5,15-methyltransferase (decarboxylating)
VLSMMQVSNDDVIWDVGAGCGGVSVELARWNDRATIYAVEQSSERWALLKKNCTQFGVVANCFPILGRAPEALMDLPSPSKVFIGGSDGELSVLLPQLWTKLAVNGVLMVTSVTDQTRQTLETFCQSLTNADIECVELAVGRGELTQTGFEFNKKRPVVILKLLKKGEVL